MMESLLVNEANDWYTNGSGQALYVDGSKIDLSPVTQNGIPEGQSKFVNFVSPQYMNTDTGSVYGTIKITALDNVGNVQLGLSNGKLDTYDFDMQSGRIARNIATVIGKAWAHISTLRTNSKSFDIYVYNTGKLSK